MKKITFNQDWLCNGKAVTLPHDAQISEPRSASASDGGHGYFPGGIYTYEKTFTVPADWADKKVLIEFEGVYKNCTVSLNGKEIGGHRYGYTGFTLPLEELNFGGLLGEGPVMPLNTASPEVFIHRGGRIPAPMHSLKN